MPAVSVKGKIYEALAMRAQEMATALGMPIAIPNVAFTPPVRDGVRKPYLAFKYQPNGSELDGLPFDGDTTHIGIIQLSVFWPAGEGLLKPSDAASLVAGWWEAGTRVWHNGIVLSIDRAPSIAPDLQESDLVQVPVTVRWRASEIKA